MVWRLSVHALVRMVSVQSLSRKHSCPEVAEEMKVGSIRDPSKERYSRDVQDTPLQAPQPTLRIPSQTEATLVSGKLET